VPPTTGAPLRHAGTDDTADKVKLKVRIGEADVSEGVIGKVRLWEEEDMPAASLKLSHRVLEETPVDYVSEIRVLAVTPSNETPLFRGLVDRVTHAESIATLDLVSVGINLKEIGMGGLGVGAGVEVLEIIWSIFRFSGVERIASTLRISSPVCLKTSRS
jgi:hypothetical protein